jgi:hypothetical protein
MHHLAIGMYPDRTSAESLVTDPTVILLFDHNSLTPSTNAAFLDDRICAQAQGALSMSLAHILKRTYDLVLP